MKLLRMAVGTLLLTGWHLSHGPHHAEAVCTPLGTTTPNLSLCKPGNSETGWTTAINDNWTILDAAGPTQKGPTAMGAGSTRTHEGTVTIATNQTMSGVHFYNNFTLNSGTTITIPAGGQRLVIVATGTITINGTINGTGAGSPGGSGGTNGSNGNGQAGGGGGGGPGVIYLAGGSGGASMVHGVPLRFGGSAGFGVGSGGAAAQITGSDAPLFVEPYSVFGGAGGGGGGNYDDANNPVVPGGTGGPGGGSIVLLAPAVTLASSATLNTSGVAGAGSTASFPGGGGGGGAGNLLIHCRTFTDNGATVIQNGGAGGANLWGVNGGAGAAGVKQIFIYQ